MSFKMDCSCIAWILFALCNVYFINGTEDESRDGVSGLQRKLRVRKSLGKLCGEETSCMNSLKNLISDNHDILYNQIQNLTNIINTMIQQDMDNDCPSTPAPTPVPGAYTPGTHYTRWGSAECPDTAEKMYDGFVAKSHYTHGGGVNYLCLPKDPEFPDNVAGGFQSQSYIYGVEYEKHNSPVVPDEKNNNDVPCALCHVTGRGEQMMLPAKKTCPQGWTQEYDGFLMSQHHSQHSADFICVDKSMEILFGGSGNANGGLLYVVEAQCGSLPCPPYVQGYELTCSVCTL